MLVLDRRGVRHLRRAGDVLTDPAQDPAQEQRRQRLIGIGLMSGAVADFACLDAIAKYLGTHMDTLQVVSVRYAAAFLLTLLISNPVSRPGLLRTQKPLLQLGRSLLLLGSTTFNFMAFRYLQLDEALAILFSTPFMVAILAGPMLGEWVGWRRWIAIGVGFIGVLVVVRPGLGGLQWAALLSFGSAVCYAFYSISTRMLARHDSSETTLFYSNMLGAVIMLPILPFVWSPPPSVLDGILMVALGGFGAFGHFLMISAHRYAPASVLSPFMYTQLVWATAFGYLIFANVPSRWTLAGAAIVIASGLYLLHRERRRNVTVAPKQPG
jgi:drug/metabolite transporter (DMT)-like permease